MEGGSGRPLFQLGLSLFLIIYTASILRRLPRYVRHSVFGPTRCVQKIVKSNSYHMFSINMLVQWNLCQSICCERQGQGRNQLQRWRVEAIFALSSKSSSLSLFALATSFSLSPSLFLSFFLSFPVCPTQQHKRQRHRTYLRTRRTSAAAAAARRVTTIRTTARRSTFWFQYRLFGAHTNLLDEFI